MTHDAGTDLDQLEVKAGQRPVGHGLGQLDAAQEGGQVVGQRVQLQPRPNPPTVKRSADRRRRLENKTLDLSEKIRKTFHVSDATWGMSAELVRFRKGSNHDLQ